MTGDILGILSCCEVLHSAEFLENKSLFCLKSSAPSRSAIGLNSQKASWFSKRAAPDALVACIGFKHLLV